jgi:ABC-2 type transport system ATP-binding protein
VLDEPANGLDPQGIHWMRQLLRDQADQGRTVLVSSHVLTEVQQLVDHVVIIDRGRLVTRGALSELAARRAMVAVRTPDASRLAAALETDTGGQIRVARTGAESLEVTGIDAARIGHLAFTERVELHELTTRLSDLEAVFLSLTAGSDALQEAS